MDEEDDGMTSGEKIIRARKACGLTQQSLAAKIGTSQQAVHQFESDKTSPTVRTLKKIADALYVPIGELVPDAVSSESVEMSKPAAGHGSAAANFNEALRQYIIHCVEAMDDRKALLELASDVERVMSMLAEEEAKAECDW